MLREGHLPFWWPDMRRTLLMVRIMPYLQASPRRVAFHDGVCWTSIRIALLQNVNHIVGAVHPILVEHKGALDDVVDRVGGHVDLR